MERHSPSKTTSNRTLWTLTTAVYSRYLHLLPFAIAYTRPTTVLDV